MTRFKIDDIIEWDKRYYNITGVDLEVAMYSIIPLKEFKGAIFRRNAWGIKWTDESCELAPESIRILYAN